MTDPLLCALVELLFRDSTLAVGVFDRELRFVRVSEALAAMNGIPAAEHPGRRLRDLLPTVADAEEEAFRRVAETRAPLTGVSVRGHTPASERERHWEVDYYPLLDGDDLIGYAATAVEQTDLVEARASLHQQTRTVYESVVQSLTAAKIAYELGGNDEVVRDELVLALDGARQVASSGVAAQLRARLSTSDGDLVVEPAGVAPAPREERIRTLVVDDDAMLRRLVVTALERLGEFDVVGEAADGGEAIDRAAQSQPDLVVLDINMPGVNGLDALPRIRSVAPSTRVAVMSGLDDADIRSMARSAGAVDYIPKGTSIAEVVRRLQAAAGGDGTGDHPAADPSRGGQPASDVS